MSPQATVKRVLLVLDTTAASLTARKLAMETASRNEALLTGLVIVDPRVITPAEPVPIGAYSYKRRKDQVLLDRAKKGAEELLEDFRKQAEKEAVRCDGRIVVEDTFKALVEGSATNDLAFAGFDFAFGASADEKRSPALGPLLHDNPRPLVVVPKDSRYGKRALVAYDGSVKAMRMVQSFSLASLGYADAIVVSVQSEASLANALCEQASQYLREHGFNVAMNPIRSRHDAASEIVGLAASVEAGIIAAGAYGGRSLRDRFFASTTDQLLATAPVPLFLHH